jgi:hypothetical protein
MAASVIAGDRSKCPPPSASARLGCLSPGQSACSPTRLSTGDIARRHVLRLMTAPMPAVALSTAPSFCTSACTASKPAMRSDHTRTRSGCRDAITAAAPNRSAKSVACIWVMACWATSGKRGCGATVAPEGRARSPRAQANRVPGPRSVVRASLRRPRARKGALPSWRAGSRGRCPVVSDADHLKAPRPRSRRQVIVSRVREGRDLRLIRRLGRFTAFGI